MYGTIARIHVRPENQQALRDVFERQHYRTVQGFMHSMLLFEDRGGAAWLVAAFTDKEAYERNAEDPEQDSRYREYRMLLESDPEWHDGHIHQLGGTMGSVTDLGLEDGSGFARGVKEEGV